MKLISVPDFFHFAWPVWNSLTLTGFPACDPIWHASSYSSEAGCITAICVYLYLFPTSSYWLAIFQVNLDKPVPDRSKSSIEVVSFLWVGCPSSQPTMTSKRSDLSLRTVIHISAPLPTGHWLFHGYVPVFGDKSFAVAGPQLWNSLLANLWQLWAI